MNLRRGHMLVLSVMLLATVATVGCKGEIALGAEEAPPLEESTPSVTAPETNEPETTPEQKSDEPSEEETTPDETPTSTADITPEETKYYLRSISQLLVSRPLTRQELDAIDAQGADAVEQILQGWTAEEGFAESIRYMMQQLLRASGQRDGIDFELPGNLAAYTAANDLPVSTIVTADYCVDADGNQIDCDTGAPYAAGVLGTRAFLAANASRFNLGRASRMMKVFACRGYPMEKDLQPLLAKESLIPMFRAETPEEQVVEEAKDAFGNGFGCYGCHGQFGAHAQLYVKFDETGMWRQDATGEQDPDGELGRSYDGLMTSHMDVPAAAASESSQIFGERVENLGEAGDVIARSDAFLPCMIRNVVQHAFGMNDSQAGEIDGEFLDETASALKSDYGEPTFGQLVVRTFSDPRVISVVLETQGGVQ